MPLLIWYQLLPTNIFACSKVLINKITPQQQSDFHLFTWIFTHAVPHIKQKKIMWQKTKLFFKICHRQICFLKKMLHFFWILRTISTLIIPPQHESSKHHESLQTGYHKIYNILPNHLQTFTVEILKSGQIGSRIFPNKQIS